MHARVTGVASGFSRTNDDHMLNVHAIPKLLVERQQAFVEDEHPVCRIVHDVGEIIGVQAKVQRVQDRPDRRNGEIRLEVFLARPRKGRHTIAGLDSEIVQGHSQPTNAVDDLPIRRSTDRPVRSTAHNLAI